jgi:hypothetical protein
MDASLHPMLELIYAAEDLKTAADAAAEAAAAAAQAAEEAAAKMAAEAEAAAAKAAEIAKAGHELQIRLMQAQGDAAGVLAAQRADEVAATDESNRAILQAIYAAEDAKVAQDALAEATAAAAQAAEEAAAKAAEVAGKRAELEIALMRALGNEAGAVAAERALQLAATDESNRALQEQVYAALDAADAQKALADAQAAAAQAAEEAARVAQELADKRMDLEIRLLRATGHELEAVAMEREREINALPESLRGLLQSVYAAEDLQAAQEKANGTLGDTAKQYRDLSKNLRDYLGSLAGAAALTPDAAYRAAGAHFGDIFQKARSGDAEALGNIQGAAQDFLQASREGAASRLDFQRDVGRVAAAVRDAIKVADATATDAERQMAELARQSDLLTTINGSVMSVHDAIMAAAEAGSQSLAVPSSAYVSVPAVGGGDTSALEARIDELSAKLAGKLDDISANTKKTSDVITRVEDQGSIAISKRSNRTLSVSVDGNVAVVNPTVEGAPVALATTVV